MELKITPGGLPYKKNGGAWKQECCGRGLKRFSPLKGTNANQEIIIITSCLQSEPNALNVVFLIDVFSNLCSYLVLYIHNRLIYAGNCKSRRFVSGRVSFYFSS